MSTNPCAFARTGNVLCCLNVAVPCVGSVLKLDDDNGEAFVGGSNVFSNDQFPTSTDCRRPVRCSSILDLEKKISEGMEFKLTPLESKKQGATLVDWVTELA